MKKLVCCILVLMSVFSCAFAESGVFVPHFDTFMDELSEKLSSIDPEIYNAMIEDFSENDTWFIPDYSISFSNRKPSLDFDAGNGFLESVRVKMLRKYYNDEAEDLFKKVMLAASTSICENTNEETFFDDIYFDYVIASPAGYMTMYYNNGVYLHKLTKSSDSYELEIYLSVYEAD